jgi:3-oxoacyl-[acyl-carrier-protein] synthase III
LAHSSALVPVKISALGIYVPPRLLTNKDLEKMVETSDEWIMSRVGIKERHIVDKGVATSDLAVEAAKQALAQRGIAPTDVQAILVGTVTPDMFFPSTACLVQHKLGAAGAWGFDVSAACSAFVYALQTGVQFVATGAHKKVMVIGADTMSTIIDYTDRNTCVIFGDGAGAVIVEPATEEGLEFIDFVHYVDGAGGCSLYMPGGGSLHPASKETVEKKMHFVHQDGQAVFKYAVRNMADACSRLLQRNGLKGSDIDCFIPHQANLRIIAATGDRLGLREGVIITNIDRYGNTTAGTIPLAMHTALEDRKLKKGDLVMLAAVGAGFTTGAALLRWAY